MARDDAALATSIRQIRAVALVRGVTRVVFGVVALAWPGLTVLVLAVVFGVYALIDGISALAAARRRHPDNTHRSLLAWIGAVGVLAGLFVILWPDVTVTAVVVLFGVWAILHGLGEIMTAVRLRRVITGELWLALAGAAAVAAGVIVLVQPSIGVAALGVIIGIAALVTGVLLLVAARNLSRFLAASGG